MEEAFSCISKFSIANITRIYTLTGTPNHRVSNLALHQQNDQNIPNIPTGEGKAVV